MNLLFLDCKYRYESTYFYCKEKNYNVVIVDRKKSSPINFSCKLKPFTEFTKRYYDIEYYKSFDMFFDMIINFNDNYKSLLLEHKLSNSFQTENEFNNDALLFFSSKNEQDKVYKLLSIPTIPSNSEDIIIKKDFGFAGGEGFSYGKRSQYAINENEFVQDLIKIDHIISCHVLIDSNSKWNILNYHNMSYLDNCPTRSVSPYFPQIEHQDFIISCISKLKTQIKVRNRICVWQFLVSKDGHIYPMDFNSRPAGGYNAGSYDTDVSSLNWNAFLIDQQKIPNVITYNSKVECHYKKFQKFGYGPYERIKTNYKTNPSREVLTL